MSLGLRNYIYNPPEALTFQVKYYKVPVMSSEKPANTDLVDPYLTEKTRRAVATALGVSPIPGKARTRLFRSLTVGKMLYYIPNYEIFCRLAQKQGQLGGGALNKARVIFE